MTKFSRLFLATILSLAFTTFAFGSNDSANYDEETQGVGIEHVLSGEEVDEQAINDGLAGLDEAMENKTAFFCSYSCPRGGCTVGGSCTTKKNGIYSLGKFTRTSGLGSCTSGSTTCYSLNF